MNRSIEIRTAYVFGYAGDFWLLFMAIAVVLWASPSFIEQESSLLKTIVLGVISFLIGLCLRFSYHGVELDAEAKRVREFTSILGFRTGEWESLPVLTRLLVTSSGSRAWNTPNGTSPTSRSRRLLYIITLVSDTPINDIAIKLQDRKQAQKNAKELAELLHLEVENTLGT